MYISINKYITSALDTEITIPLVIPAPINPINISELLSGGVIISFIAPTFFQKQ